MADIKVQKVEKPEDRTLPVFRALDEVFERIRQRAFELFAGRGFKDGDDLGDWIAAEHELCWPATELLEHDGGYVLKVALPGFEPGQVSVTATPRELIVHASAKTERREGTERAKAGTILWSEFRNDDVYRRIEFSDAIDLSRVSANLANGLLKIVAAKAPKTATRVPVAAAA